MRYKCVVIQARCVVDAESHQRNRLLYYDRMVDQWQSDPRNATLFAADGDMHDVIATAIVTAEDDSRSITHIEAVNCELRINEA